MRVIVTVGLCLTLILSIMCAAHATEEGEGKAPSYVGKWLRIKKYANGKSLKVNETATLVLTENSFTSDSRGVPGAECTNSGRLTIDGNKMTMKVTASTCPSIITVGSIVQSTYSVSTDWRRLTITNTEWGYTYKEVLKRQ